VFWLIKISLPVEKLIYLPFYDIWGYLKVKIVGQKIFPPLSFDAVVGFGMDKKSGSGINISDTQHCFSRLILNSSLRGNKHIPAYPAPQRLFVPVSHPAPWLTCLPPHSPLSVY
jgi:hypothetical protein